MIHHKKRSIVLQYFFRALRLGVVEFRQSAKASESREHCSLWLAWLHHVWEFLHRVLCITQAFAPLEAIRSTRGSAVAPPMEGIRTT